MTTEGLRRWINDNVVDVDGKINNLEYKNYSQTKKDLELIEDIIRSKIPPAATQKKKEGIIKGFEKIKEKFLEREMNESVNEANIKYKEGILSKANIFTRLSQFKAQRIDKEYLIDTIKEIKKAKKDIVEPKRELRHTFFKGIKVSKTLEDVESLRKEIDASELFEDQKKSLNEFADEKIRRLK